MSVPVNASMEIRGAATPDTQAVLTDEVLAFLSTLTRAFRPGARELLAARASVEQERWQGISPVLRADSAELRESTWQIPSPGDFPQVLLAGGAEPKTLINGLNSPADAYMVDLENGHSPGWAGMIAAHRAITLAVQRALAFDDPESSRSYQIAPDSIPLALRPRALHQWEKHVYFDGQPVPAALFDLCVFLTHNLRVLTAQGRRALLLLPKIRNQEEAAWWADVLDACVKHFDVGPEHIRVSVIVDTLNGSLELNEIIYALRTYASSISCNRWDYAFSVWKERAGSGWLLPDRQVITQDQAFIEAWSRWVASVARRRGLVCLGSATMELPVRNDEDAQQQAAQRFVEDKRLEHMSGCDGSWVVHPEWISLARDSFANSAPGAEITCPQIAELWSSAQGESTESGVRNAISICIQYVQAWLQGRGCVPLYNLMEDMATVELCRAQLWQALHADGEQQSEAGGISRELFDEMLAEEMANIEAEVGLDEFALGRYQEAAELIARLSTANEFVAHLCQPAYELLN